MTNPPPFVGMLVEGAILTVPLIVIAFLLSRFTRDIVGRSLLVIFLFVAAGAYFGFTLLAAPGPIWLLAELVQVIVFGTMALLGLCGSPWWLVAGRALHPLWDVVLHYLGPGHSFAPTAELIKADPVAHNQRGRTSPLHLRALLPIALGLSPLLAPRGCAPPPYAPRCPLSCSKPPL
jgi:hypothetical protein